MTVLVVGVILIALLVGVSALQWLLRRREAGIERRMPHVGELAELALPESNFPPEFSIDYRGPMTNERLAQGTDDEAATLDELDEQGRVIGYRQRFRDPKSYGELADVLLNHTLRSGTQHRLYSIDISLYEDSEGASEAVNETPPQPADADSEGVPSTIRVADIGTHSLDFAESVRSWSRMDEHDAEVQRKIEVRWRAGRLGCVVAGDSEPAGGIEASEVCRLAQIVQNRVRASSISRDA